MSTLSLENGDLLGKCNKSRIQLHRSQEQIWKGMDMLDAGSLARLIQNICFAELELLNLHSTNKGRRYRLVI